MAQTSVVADLLQALQILTQLGTNIVGNNVRPLSINAILGSVEEPARDSVRLGLSHNLDNLVNLIPADLSGSATFNRGRKQCTLVMLSQQRGQASRTQHATNGFRGVALCISQTKLAFRYFSRRAKFRTCNHQKRTIWLSGERTNANKQTKKEKNKVESQHPITIAISPLRDIDTSLLGAQDGIATTNTLNAREGKGDGSVTVKVGVVHTQNVQELALLHNQGLPSWSVDEALKKKKKHTNSHSTNHNTNTINRLNSHDEEEGSECERCGRKKKRRREKKKSVNGDERDALQRQMIPKVVREPVCHVSSHVKHPPKKKQKEEKKKQSSRLQTINHNKHIATTVHPLECAKRTPHHC